MKIYSKTGDKGETGRIGGSRIGKDSLNVAVVGDVDELNAALGVALSLAADSKLSKEIADIQNWLFDLGAELSTPCPGRKNNPRITMSQVKVLEASIDSQMSVLPPLRNFILPGGSQFAAALHHARCVCRRAEREIVKLNRVDPVSKETLAFMNRLSDWIFLAARTANAELGVKDIEWNSEG